MMRLPHTDNAEHLWAFKKGYRFAQQGKPLREMPMTIRIDPILRDYFQQGYDQAQQQLVQQQGPQLTPKKRALWLVLTLIAGLATAKLMIDEMRQEAPPAPPAIPLTELIQQRQAVSSEAASPQNQQQEQSKQPATSDQPDTPSIPQSIETHPNPAEQADQPTVKNANPVIRAHDSPVSQISIADKTPPASQQAPDFALLDAEARAKQLQINKTDAALPPVGASDIQVTRAVLAAGIEKREPVGVLDDVVPKSMRKVVFFTEIRGAEGRTIIHRWRYGSRIMAEVRLPIRSDDFRTWSSKRMSPAWAGRWWVEVVDDKGQVIARKGFRYVR